MAILIIGLVLFLGLHSVRIFADDWRTQTITRLGQGPWKGIYSLLSIAGFVLIVWGYGQARIAPTLVWLPPPGMAHATSLLTWLSLILMAAAYVPGNRIRAKVGHPMTLSVKVWALAHLLSNGMLADIILFGSFLVWSILVFRSARRRPATSVTVGSMTGDIGVVIVGTVAWLVFAMWLHGWLIGVRPFG